MTVATSPLPYSQVAFNLYTIYSCVVAHKSHGDNSTSSRIILYIQSIPSDVDELSVDHYVHRILWSIQWTTWSWVYHLAMLMNYPPYPLCYLFNEPPQVGPHFLHCSLFDVCSKYEQHSRPTEVHHTPLRTPTRKIYGLLLYVYSYILQERYTNPRPTRDMVT